MKTIGLGISGKENERRRALIPADLENIRHPEKLFFEKNYGVHLGFSDQDYISQGVNVVSKEIVYEKDIIINLKTPTDEEKKYFSNNQTLFGWIHAVQNKEITDFLIDKEMTAIAMENMFDNGRHIFWKNNELAGECAILHSLLYYGKKPSYCSAAVIGRGNVARGAIRALEKLGSDVIVYEKKTISHLKNELGNYDLIVNCVLWDVFRKDRILYRSDLRKMKKNAMIIDVSCNNHLEIETSHPTTIENPVYEVDGILHYVVDHTPALCYETASDFLSEEISNFVDDLIEENENRIINNAIIINNGKITDEDIIKFQDRKF